ncbi:MarR family transcriptional regulator [Qipengyuania sp. JC766]|uniref:MarR family transcriptional regulator n=1 Tax=Qipengyuania sp. JC766 TaxID=3232139 RepID=UPI0034585EBC
MQAQYDYSVNETVADAANDAAGLPLFVSVFADRPALRDQMRDDALAAGLRVGQVGGLDLLLEGEARALGDIVLVDCPADDARSLAALERADMRAGRCDARLLVSTTLDALDAVFGCLSLSAAPVLVDPGRGDRVVALGRALSRVPDARLREFGEEDRISLLRLTEQVGQLARQLELANAQGLAADGGAFRFRSPDPAFKPAGEDRAYIRQPRPPLPDAALVRKVIAKRRSRAALFDDALFADPAWDMLLDLTAARAEHTRVSVTSLCIAAHVPPTTALRWITQMVEDGILVREADEMDKRRTFIALSDDAAEAMARYFADKEAAVFAA